MNGADLLATALEFIENTPPSAIEFGGNPTLLSREPWQARTMCSTLITMLERDAGRSVAKRNQIYGSAWPRAEDFHRAILQRSGFIPVERVREVKPGDLIAIRFKERLDGFSGHCALVASIPEETIPGRWRVAVIDSTNSPHGAQDPRMTSGVRGLGLAAMWLLVDSNGTIAGYQWSATSEPRWISEGERMVAVGRFV